MGKYKLEDGSEIEAFTQEEVDAKVAEQTKQLQTDLEAAKDKAQNLETKAKGAEKAKDENQSEVEKLQKQIDDMNQKFSDNYKNRFVNEAGGS